jgi:hypothetical protein
MATQVLNTVSNALGKIVVQLYKVPFTDVTNNKAIGTDTVSSQIRCQMSQTLFRHSKHKDPFRMPYRIVKST